MVRTGSEDNFQGLVFAFPCQARESPASAAALHSGDQLARKPLAGSPVWPAYPAAETTGERHPPHCFPMGSRDRARVLRIRHFHPLAISPVQDLTL